MNTLNRVLVVLSLVGLLVILVAGLWQPTATLEVAGRGVDGLQTLVGTSIYLYLACEGALLLLVIALLVLELRRPGRQTVKVRQVSGSTVELSTESVGRGLAYHIAQVPGVLQVRPRVVSTGKAVKVSLDLETDPAADVPAKSEEVLELAREIIEGKLGVKVTSISANVRQADYSEGEPRVRQLEEPTDEPPPAEPFSLQ